MPPRAPVSAAIRRFSYSAARRAAPSVASFDRK